MFYICGDSNYNHKLNIKHYIMLQFEVNGKLGKGHYRIVKEVKTNLYIAAEFDI